MCENENPSDEISYKDLYCMVREQIKHEDELVNQRLNWFLVTQGFLIATFGAVYSSDINHIKNRIEILNPILISITILGTLLGLLSYLGIRIAHISISNLVQTWEEQKETWKNNKNINFPQIIWKGNQKQWKANYTTMGIPALFTAIWLFLCNMVIYNINGCKIAPWQIIVFSVELGGIIVMFKRVKKTENIK